MKISTTFKAIRKAINHDKVRKSVDFSLPSMPMVNACRADEFDFFQPFIDSGRLTIEQMHHACQRYLLGKTKSGQPIFWMIDDMFMPLDAHIGSTWISTLLKAREPLIASWQVTHCLFGLHLLSNTNLTNLTNLYPFNPSHPCSDYIACANNSCYSCNSCSKEEPVICVIESEKSALILSELFPESLWMAYATPTHFTPELFAPLQGYSVIIYPRTDPVGDYYLASLELADQVRRLYHLDITVDSTLEDYASPSQKSREIDLLDFLL